MQIKPLYKYEWAKGKIEVSPIKPEDKPYIDMYRLIADEGKMLAYNNVIMGNVIDIDTLDGWSEVETSEEEVKHERE